MTTIAEQMNENERKVEKYGLHLIVRDYPNAVELHNLFLQSMALKYRELGQEKEMVLNNPMAEGTCGTATELPLVVKSEKWIEMPLGTATELPINNLDPEKGDDQL